MESRSSFISALWGVVLLGLLVISGHAQAQTSVTNTATLSPPTGWRCASPTEQDGCTVRSSVTNQVGSPELSLLKQADQTQLVVGGSVVYTLEVANNGNLATAGVITVRDVLPAGLSFVSAAGDGWLCTASGNVVICTRTAAVAANAQAPVITVTASVLPAALPQVINTATVAGGGDARCPTESPNTQACGSSVTTPVLQPVVTVAKAANPASGSTVQRGDIINYTLTATVSGAATVATTTLTDTLSSGLVFLTPLPAGCTASGQVMSCVLSAGTAVGSAVISYQARVANDASGTVSNAVTGVACTAGASCTTSHPVVLPSVGVAKSTTAAGSVQVGDVLDYTLTVTVADADSLADVVLTDALGTGLELVAGSVSGTGFTIGATSSNGFTATLPAGAAPNVHTLTYQARVTAAAGTAVSNTVTPTGAPCAGSCTTTTPVIKPAVALSKTAAAPRNPAQVNDLISYTLRVSVTDARTVERITLTDTLGAGLELVAGSINAGLFTCNAANPLVCTLPAGTAVGNHEVTYQARVTSAATGTVSNSVSGAPCATGACTTTTPVAQPSVGVAKSTTATGTVQVGDVLDYTLTVTVADADSLADVVLTDALGTGLELVAGSVSGTGFTIGTTSSNGFTATLSAGAAPNVYTLTYQATVTAAAGTAVSNTVTPTGAPCAGSCTTTTPVIKPGVALSKTAAAPRNPAQVSDLISYTLRVSVTDARTIDPVELTDTLGAGLELVAGSINAGLFTCNAANPLVCTLPAGTAVGNHEVTYQARVTTAATGTVSNSVSGAPCATGACTTTTPVAQPSVGVAKSTTATGTVQVGDVLDYTLTVTVADADSLADVVLTDALGTGLELVAGSVSGTGFTIGTTSSNGFTATLPAGAAPNVYTLTYQATVTAAAGTAVSNTVTPTGAPCAGSCTTTTPVIKPAVALSKTAAAPRNPAQVNDLISYTLRVSVTDARTVELITLTDTLGTGLELVAGSINAGLFTCNAANPLVCTLPAGTAVGNHEVTYQARVTSAATGTVSNSVSGAPCATGACTTTTPVAQPSVGVAKSTTAAGSVQVGDVLDYTLTVTVADADSLADVVLTDALGTGLELVAGSVSGTGFTIGATSSNGFTATLPAGAAPNVHTLTYQARVTAAAGTAVSNTVTPTGAPCAGSCTTTTPVIKPAVALSKTAAAPRNPAQVNDLISYTLRVSVTDARTVELITLTDTLGTGLELVAGSINAGLFTCNAANPLVCTLPAGTAVGNHEVTYQARVTTAATGTVSNSVSGAPCATGACTTTTPVAQPSVGVAKSTTAAGSVQVGDVLDYTLTVTVADADSLADVVLTDALGTGLELVAGSVSGTGFTIGTTSSNGFTATLPAGAAPNVYTLTYQATVTAAAGTAVSNTVTPTGAPCAGSCTTTTPVIKPGVTVSKSVDKTGPVTPGETLTYTVRVEVVTAGLTQDLTLVDTLSGKQTFVAFSNTAGFTCPSLASCVLPAGTQPGAYQVVYTTTVDADATGSVGNSVVASNPGGDPPPVCSNCTTTTPVVVATSTINKTVDKTGPVQPGETLTYTVTTLVSGSALVDPITLVDTLSDNQTFGAVTHAGAYTCSGSLTCVLAAGTLPGSYAVTYTATVNADATGSVGNVVSSLNTSGSTPQPVCEVCTTTTPVIAAATVVSKSVDTTGPVSPGDTLTYTIDVQVSGSVLTQDLTLVDTLSGKQTFVAFSNTAGFNCPSLAGCVLPAGTVPGNYRVVYTTTVDADATGTVGNTVVASNPADGDPDPVCTTCSTITPVVKSVARVSKSVAQTQAVRPGDVLDFTLVLDLEQAANAGDISLIDTLGEGLEFVGVTDAGVFSCSRELTCILAAGHLPGQYRVTYQARVTAAAGADVRNQVVAIEQDPYVATPSLPGDPGQPLCESCLTITPVAREVNLRISKVAAVREASIGDLVRYTLQVDNIGDGDLVDGVVVDTAPAGFSLVAGSLVVIDGDNAAEVSNGAPLRFTGIDIAAGQQAQLVYLMRVGAGVRNGVQVNRAQVRDAQGNPVSNEATAQVLIGGDPLLEDSLLLGTVFDDRNGDGRQASARLTGVVVQGGFDPAAYIANSTTIERNGVREPLADASSPLLHGVDIGTLAGRSSSADDGAAGSVVIRQRLREPAFNDGFTLRSGQGLALTLDAAGQARVTRSGEAASGLNSAELQVERRISPVADGYEVAYVIRNTGIDERGIPGVRIASVEGLLMETDQFGRYHLVGISAGEQARGRHHVLKVDPSTLPAGAQFTTDNPLLRRITPGMPARFDFGVRLPVEEIGGRSEQVELELGQVLFAPGSAQLQDKYRPVVEQVAGRIGQYNGGEVVIAADGEGQALALARAEAVHKALRDTLDPALLARVTVQVRAVASEAGSTLVGLQGEDLQLGSVLFDTDKSDIKPEFEALLDAVAARLQQRRGGTVAIIGHTDVRGSHAYNAALGLSRAKAVHEALMRRLSQDVRDHVRVDASGDTTAPIDAGRE